MSRRLLRYGPLALLAAASALVIVFGADRWLNLEHLFASRAGLRAFAAQDRPLAMLAAYAAHVAAIVASMPVSALMTMLHGFLFGWPAGAALALAAATSGGVIVFAVARTALGDRLARRAGPRMARLAEGFERDAFSYVLALRLVPLVPFWVVNLAAPVFGARLRAFVPATLLGTLPASLIFATAGAGVEGVIAAHEAARAACPAGAACVAPLTVRAFLTPQLVAALAGLALLALLPVVLRRRRGAP